MPERGPKRIEMHDWSEDGDCNVCGMKRIHRHKFYDEWGGVGPPQWVYKMGTQWVKEEPPCKPDDGSSAVDFDSVTAD